MVMACANKYTANTQPSRENPPRSPIIVGIAVATIVASMADINIANMQAIRINGR
ncbi:hypothetical protein D3C87_2112200 [compost metagenome]